MQIPGIYGPERGVVLPDTEKVGLCPPNLQAIINQLAPPTGMMGYFERVRPVGQEYWFEKYQGNELDDLWVRRADGSFRLECTFPRGLVGEYIIGLYNTDTSNSNITEIGDYGPGIALHSSNPSEILAVRKCDNESRFKSGLNILDALIKEKRARRKEFIGQYAMALHIQRLEKL